MKNTEEKNRKKYEKPVFAVRTIKRDFLTVSPQHYDSFDPAADDIYFEEA